MMRSGTVILLIALMLCFGGCSRDSGLEPPQILFGQQECEVCRMIITDERFACAAIVESDGRRHAVCFDDLGCLIRHEQEAADAHRVARRYVKDARTMHWLDATTAVYIRSDAIRSPMGFGVAAAATTADAESLRHEFTSETPSDILGWDALVLQPETSKPSLQTTGR